jgi:hypothetical protein
VTKEGELELASEKFLIAFGIILAVFAILAIMPIETYQPYFKYLGGTGTLSFTYASGTSPITSITLQVPQDLVGIMIIDAPPSGWSLSQTGNTIRLTGGSLSPGGSLSATCTFSKYVAAGTRPMPVTALTLNGESISGVGGVVVQNMWIVYLITLLSDFKLPLLIGSILLLGAGLFLWFKKRKNQAKEKQPPVAPPKAEVAEKAPVVQPAVVPTKQTQTKEEFSYEASLHTDTDPLAHEGGAGHAWADLRATKTVKDESGKVLSTETTESIYDFAPADGSWSGILSGPGQLIANTRVVNPEEVTGKMESVKYWKITMEGYYRAKTWGDAVANLKGGKKTANPLTPGYKLLFYNCVDFSLMLVRMAGVDLPSGFGGVGVSRPNALAANIKIANCQHVFGPPKTIWVGEGLPFKTYSCSKCGYIYSEPGVKFE